MIKAVFFDLDGTLVNSLEDLATSANYALKEFGFPQHAVEKYKYFIGDGMQKLIERVLPENERTAEIKQRVFQSFWNHYAEHYIDKTVVYDGIKELLTDLRKEGLKIAVVSNKAQEMALEVTNKLLGDSLDVVCGKQEGYLPKPDPKLTMKTMGEMGVKPEECVFIGDSGMDAATAVNIGCVGIGVLWGFRTEDELLDNGAKFIVEKPNRILDIIHSLN